MAQLMVGFTGTSIHDPDVQHLIPMIADQRIHGVILFRHNITGPQQVADLVGTLKGASPDPQFIVAVDQEGGRVQRLGSFNGFHDTPSAAYIGRLPLEEAATHYQAMAKMLADVGFNLNFGPVVDLLGTPGSSVIGGLERAYSTDPQQVIAYAKVFIAAHRLQGVRTCLKHFPGHGLAQGDTHEGIVDVTDTLQPQEMVPFQDLIDAEQADAVMAAHVWHQGVDSEYPVSLSPFWLRDILRVDMGFEGTIISDDLHMGAILSRYSLGETMELGLRAGLDVLVFSRNPKATGGQTFDESLETIVHAFEDLNESF